MKNVLIRPQIKLLGVRNRQVMTLSEQRKNVEISELFIQGKVTPDQRCFTLTHYYIPIG